MATITALTPQKRHPHRHNVFVNGQFAFGIDAIAAQQLGLHVGREVSTSEIEEFRSVDDVARATDAAIRLLAQRPRSTNELRTRLRQKDFAEPTIDAAFAKLERWNYVDDEAFARYWVENRESFRPRSKRMLEQELRWKGVDRDTIRDAIDSVEIDELSAATELARDKLRVYGSLEPDVARRRLAGFLARRGYGWDVVKPALDRVLGETDESLE